ncbi:hypothetical protein JCM17380_16480 [Desulfosporosinus burensis]
MIDKQGNKSKTGKDGRTRVNEGKKFEKDIKNSIPADVYCYRIKDDGMNFLGVANICDFIVYKYPFLYLWELKSHKGKCIPFSAIREQQLIMLDKIDPKGVSTGFILNFRDWGETYWVETRKLQCLKGKEERKSISLDWCRTEGIKVEQRLKRTRYLFDIPKLLSELSVILTCVNPCIETLAN